MFKCYQADAEGRFEPYIPAVSTKIPAMHRIPLEESESATSNDAEPIDDGDGNDGFQGADAGAFQ